MTKPPVTLGEILGTAPEDWNEETIRTRLQELWDWGMEGLREEDI